MGAKKGGWLALLLMVALLADAMLSGNRTAFLLFFLIGATSALAGNFTRGLLGLAVLVVSLSVIGLALVTTLGRDVIDSLIQASRLDLLSEGIDQSNYGRINEVLDILHILREKPFHELALGSGHGALWENVLSAPEMNIEHDGKIHNIHFTYAAVAHKYGLVGLLAIGTLAAWNLRCLARVFLRRTSAPQAILTIATTGALLAAVTNNVFFDPIAMFVVAGFLMCSLERR
jgi:O-Antigen ligase